MRPRARSISRAHRAVRDTESGLHVLCLGLVQERGGHSPVVLYRGSVAKLLFREFWRLEVIEFPRADFRILPLKSKFATEP
jgi:hypothetical protein